MYALAVFFGKDYSLRSEITIFYLSNNPRLYIVEKSLGKDFSLGSYIASLDFTSDADTREMLGKQVCVTVLDNRTMLLTVNVSKAVSSGSLTK